MGTSQKVFTTTLWGLMVLGMLGLVGTGLLATHRAGVTPLIAVAPEKESEHGLPILFDLPAFELVDQNNQPITDQQLKGHPFVGCFVFTHCAGPCPMMYSKLAEMQKDLIEAGVKSVCFSVDPSRDTPEVLKAKAKELNADESSWSFITGEKAKVDKLLREMLQPRPGPADNPLMHDTKFYLFDAQGQCRGRYSSTDNDSLTALKRDAATLGAEAKARGQAFVTLADFPAINASLNAASGLLLLGGFVCIKRRAIVAHATCMICAVACSAAFLSCYVYYHAHVGTTRVKDAFPDVPATLRGLYYVILFPHLTLAMVMLPMIVITLTYAARRNWPKHIKIAPWTSGIWLYVSVTGVIIYWMLYHLFPGIQG